MRFCIKTAPESSFPDFHALNRVNSFNRYKSPKHVQLLTSTVRQFFLDFLGDGLEAGATGARALEVFPIQNLFFRFSHDGGGPTPDPQRPKTDDRGASRRRETEMSSLHL